MGKINNSIVLSDENILQEKGFKLDRVIGEGSFSKVKSAIWKKPGTSEELPVAIKIINRTTAPKNFLERFWPREAELMGAMVHDNIIKMYEVFTEGNKIYMCLEKAAHGDLLERVLTKGALNEVETHKYFSQMCQGIDYLHTNNIVHRDLKCENVLLTQSNCIKIADFGFARRMNEGDLSETFCGSAAYAAPEILRGVAYEAFVPDLWSLGVILFIMFFALMPFRDSSIGRLLKDQKTSSLQFPDQKKMNPKYRDLVSKILYYDISKRLRLNDIRNHDWMTSSPKVDQTSSLTLTDSGIISGGSDVTVSSSE
ncbi:testis-specific serine/threonine-protein kinase 1-like [Clavelina lepadiformis]